MIWVLIGFYSMSGFGGKYGAVTTFSQEFIGEAKCRAALETLKRESIVDKGVCVVK